MKKLLALVLLLLAIPVFALADAGEYEVNLPDGYDAGEARYPVVYVLPEDDGLPEKLQGALDAIIVRPAFEAGGDPAAALSAIIAEVDSSYRTVADAQHRALAGTGVGGYLAYALGLSGDSCSMMFSVRGDFASEQNPYIAALGDVYAKVQEMRAADEAVFDGLYTYMDAPVEDAFSSMPGSTADLGALFITYGTGSAAHEFTLRAGSYDEAFLAESAARIAARLNERWYPAPQEETEQPLVIPEPQPPVIEGDYQAIDLAGEWNFFYAGAEDGVNAAALTPADIAAWPLAPAALCNWTNGLGNISDENVNAMYGPDYFDYFIVGAGYYAKAFTVPAEFDAQEIVLSIGYVDDRCEVFMNGVRVGATGMDENGQPNGETSWAVYSNFSIDPSLVNVGGENLVVVRAWNDVPMGAGGWYAGPVGLYSAAAFNEINPEKPNPRFYEETFSSAHAAAALGQEAAIDNKYLVYLPEGYETSGRRYPTVYLLHQFNSDHTSYKTDKVDLLLDAGVTEGLFDEMIVVIPNSSEESWWTGEWEKMITDELIPAIDAKYRTIRDARFRLTAGCSMGGQGSMGVALRNPDFFSGAISFFGAFSYGGASSPNAIAAAESAEYMDSFSLYFICGNQDSYGFGAPAIELHKQLDAMDVNHGFFIENGGHDSAFYVPYFKDAFAYIRKDMYKSDEAIEAILSGSAAIDENVLTIEIAADAAIEAYFYAVPASTYTKNPAPALSIPLTVELRQDGVVVHTFEIADHTIASGNLTETIVLNTEGLGDACLPIDVTVKAQLFDRVVTICE